MKTESRFLRAKDEESPTSHGLQFDKAALGRLLPYARRELSAFVLGFLLMPLMVAASVAQPYLVGRAINAIVALRSLDALTYVVLLYAGCIGVEFVTRFGQVYLHQKAGFRAMAALRTDVFAHVQRLPMRYFDQTPVGRITTRVTSDIDSLGELFSSGAISAVGDILLLVSIVAMMLFIDWRLSIFAFLALPPLAIFVEVFRRYARTAFRVIRAKTAELNGYLSEQVTGVGVINGLAAEERAQREYAEMNEDYRDANHKSVKYDALLYSVVEGVAAVCVALVLWYAAVRVGALDAESSKAYVGTVVAFYEYLNRFFLPIRDLSGKFTIIQQSMASAERVFGLLDMPEERTEASAPRETASASEVEPHIEFDHVSFRYRSEGPMVLDDISLRIGKHERIAIVGASGSGKTTLVSLLLRLYSPLAGTIRIAGRDASTMRAEDQRASFGVVSQDVFLFSGSVLDNIALGEATPDRARAARILLELGATDLFEARGGLDSIIAERGTNFSAGERQLIALARVVYRNAPVLILDEATANIDAETEARVGLAVMRVLQERTAVVIAHRLSTIRDADRIIVMHKGRIVEEGTHDVLIRSGGVYARLSQLHFGVSEGPESAQVPSAPIL